MDQQTILSIVLIVVVFILVIFLLPLFRKQISDLIRRLTKSVAAQAATLGESAAGSIQLPSYREAKAILLEEDLLSLQGQIVAARESLRLVEKRKAEFVLSTDIPLQLVKEERLLLDRIAELEQQLAALSTVVGPGRDSTGNIPEPKPDPTPREQVEQSPIPSRPYRHLIGRQAELDEALAVLRKPQEKKMIALTGMGGIGKTALAHEVIEQCQNERLFDFIVWVSDKTEYYDGQSIRKIGSVDLTFERLLDDIGRQCKRLDIPKMERSKKHSSIQALLAHRRVMIVVDNLDTVPDYEGLAGELYAILGRSKALLTSRFLVRRLDIYTIELGGLDTEAGRAFLRDEARARNIQAVVKASNAKLNEIHRATGGAPLAMQWVVGQMSCLPMEVVLDSLKQADCGSPNELYRFLFQQSWKLLDMNARKTLVDMSVFPPGIGGAVDDVLAVSQVEPSAFWPAIERLVTLSLVNKTGSASRERFYLHQLTHNLVHSGITEKWL